MIYSHLEKMLEIIGDKVLNVAYTISDASKKQPKSPNMTSELVITRSPRNVVLETRSTLNQKTKREICEMADDRFGIELNFKTEKKYLITQYLAAQNI